MNNILTHFNSLFLKSFCFLSKYLVLTKTTTFFTDKECILSHFFKNFTWVLKEAVLISPFFQIILSLQAPGRYSGNIDELHGISRLFSCRMESLFSG